MELRYTCNRTQVGAGDEGSGSLTPQVVELRLVKGRSPPEYDDNTGDSLQMEVEQWHGKLSQAPLSRLTRACAVVLGPYAEGVAVAVGLQQEYASEVQRRSCQETGGTTERWRVRAEGLEGMRKRVPQ